MGTITTEAWVLEQGVRHEPTGAVLKRQEFSFPDITDEEVLAEPIFGSWEGNMTHALERDPVDICRLRREKRVVIGNSGVMRVLAVGSQVDHVREGDIGVLVPIGTADDLGYTIKVFGYDAPQTIGFLAKRIKVHKRQILLLPRDTKHSLQQWASVSIRYATAYANWKLAYGCWLMQVSEDDSPAPWVWGWGGGVSLAELCLAKMAGCRVAMIASNERRLEQARSLGITAIDRRQFSDLNFDETRYEPDRQYRARYLQAESAFLDVVERITEGRGVAVFIDNIGRPVFRATLKALARQGVVTTSGWKHGMSLSVSRAAECINRHIHVHTHGTRESQAATVVAFCEQTGWMPPLDSRPYGWDQIPQLARDYAENRIDTYFPVFQVNEI